MTKRLILVCWFSVLSACGGTRTDPPPQEPTPAIAPPTIPPPPPATPPSSVPAPSPAVTPAPSESSPRAAPLPPIVSATPGLEPTDSFCGTTLKAEVDEVAVNASP